MPAYAEHVFAWKSSSLLFLFFFLFFLGGGGGGAGGLLCLGVLGRTEEEILDVSQGNAHPEVKSNVLYFVVYLSICM